MDDQGPPTKDEHGMWIVPTDEDEVLCWTERGRLVVALNVERDANAVRLDPAQIDALIAILHAAKADLDED